MTLLPVEVARCEHVSPLGLSFPTIGDNSVCTWEKASVAQTPPSQPMGPRVPNTWVSSFLRHTNPRGRAEGERVSGCRDVSVPVVTWGQPKCLGQFLA